MKELTRGTLKAGVSGQPSDSCKERHLSDCVRLFEHPFQGPAQKQCPCGFGACWRSLPVVPMRPVFPVSPVAPAEREDPVRLHVPLQPQPSISYAKGQCPFGCSAE